MIVCNFHVYCFFPLGSRQKLVACDISLSHAAWKTYPSTTVEAEDGSISSGPIIATSHDLGPQKVAYWKGNLLLPKKNGQI